MGDADYFLSAENELLRYPEAMSEELWSDLAIRMLVGLAERADEDGKVDLYVEASPLETLLHAAGHQRISWILLHQHSFDHPTVDPRNDELFAMLDDGLAAMRSLIEAGDLEIVTVAGDIYFRIANLESMLSESANRPTQDADAVALLRAKAARIRELREMAYDDYLQSPEWRARRQRHIDYAGGRCQLCNDAPAVVHVHHRTYARRGFERAPDLIVLCPDCHKVFHQHRRVR